MASCLMGLSLRLVGHFLQPLLSQANRAIEALGILLCLWPNGNDPEPIMDPGVEGSPRAPTLPRSELPNAPASNFAGVRVPELHNLLLKR